MNLPIQGDLLFRGVNLRLDPAVVPEGYCTEAVNLRFDAGVAESRKGMVRIGWLNKVQSAYGAWQFTPWATVYGTGSFVAANSGVAYRMIAADGNVYACTQFNAPKLVSLPDGVTITSAVTFTQCAGELVMFRGEDLAPLSLTDLAVGFAAIAKVDYWPVEVEVSNNRFKLIAHGFQVGDLVRFTATEMPEGDPPLVEGQNYYVATVPTPDHFTVLYVEAGNDVNVLLSSAGSNVNVNAADGAEAIPNASRGLYVANRLLVPYADDRVAVSDILDVTRYQPQLAEFRVSQGTSDSLVALAQFGDSTVVGLKRHSVDRIDGVYGNLEGMSLSNVTRRFGIAAADTVVDCGVDLLWLSLEGVASLSLTEQSKMQASQGAYAGRPPMLSDPILPLIKRINWQYVSGAKAALWNNRYYLAVPLDDAEAFGFERILDQVELDPVLDTTVKDLVVGRTYRFLRGAGNTTITNGTWTSSTSQAQVDFVATATTATIDTNLPTDTMCDASLRELFKGVNNALLVYDFTNAAWSGYDTADELTIQEMFVDDHNGQERLFIVTCDGWVVMLEEDSEDHILRPYVRLQVTAKPADGNWFQINGGDVIGASSTEPQGEGYWHTPSLATAKSNLFITGAASNVPSLSPFGTTQWTVPNTWITRNADGDINIYGINGLMPEITITGSWATLTYHPTQGISTALTTRGYSSGTTRQPSHYVDLILQSWAPTLSASLIHEGVLESDTLISAETRSRTTYERPFDAAAWVDTNASNDFSTPYRQDYSIVLPTAGMTLPPDGVVLDYHQEQRRTFSVLRRSRAPRVRVTNTTGRVRLMAAALEKLDLDRPQAGTAV